VYLGIDLGTSGVKIVLVDEVQRVVAQASAALQLSRPRPLWSEQDPEDWWRATESAVALLRRSHAAELVAVRAIGLSGQMHGATLLDDGDRVLRPAILWNDGRSGDACRELERRLPEVSEITGNTVMPGFTAPKLVWVAQHEPRVFERTARVLLPKDWLRLRLTGEHASEMSDASGTLWLDVGARRWSDAVLEATGLGPEAMPVLFEGSEPTGTLRPELAQAWNIGEGVVVAGGAGDQAAGAVGAGVVEPGQGFLALGTSGVTFVAGARFAPNPGAGVHAFCHALPGRWHQMSVILSAAVCISWVARLTGARDEAALLAEVEAADRRLDSLLFLPYLSGERTPHNDPNAKGVFFGMTHDTERADLGRAVLEGVAFALADGQIGLVEGGAHIDSLAVIGGGARSAFWGRILASVLDRELSYCADAEVGPAFGAARLGRLALTGEDPASVCTAPAPERVVAPEPALRDHYRERHRAYRRLYAATRGEFTP
jgi:xylulokinase